MAIWLWIVLIAIPVLIIILLFFTLKYLANTLTTSSLALLFIAGFSSLYFYLFLIVTLFLGIIFSFLVILSSVPIAFLITGIFLFFVARGIWKGRKWAKIAIIILLSLAILSELPSLIATFLPENIQGIFSNLTIENILSLSMGFLPSIINLLILGYLLFSKRAKEAFAKS